MAIQVTVPCVDGHALARLQTVLIEMRMPFSVDPSDHYDEGDEGDEDEVDSDMLLTILSGARERMGPAGAQLNELIHALQAPEPSMRIGMLHQADQRPTLPFRRPSTSGQTVSDRNAKDAARAIVACPRCGAGVNAWCKSPAVDSMGSATMHKDRLDLIHWLG